MPSHLDVESTLDPVTVTHAGVPRHPGLSHVGTGVVRVGISAVSRSHHYSTLLSPWSPEVLLLAIAWDRGYSITGIALRKPGCGARCAITVQFGVNVIDVWVWSGIGAIFASAP